MAHRIPNVVFLETMVELRFRLGIIKAVLENDDALSTLANTGFNREKLEDTALKLARPLLAVLLEFLTDKFCIFVRPDGHEEHSTTISILIRTINHATISFADKSQPFYLRRCIANYNVGRCKALVGLAIRSEIGVMADEKARKRAKRMAARTVTEG